MIIIPQIPRAYYKIDITWDSLEFQIKRYKERYNFNDCPDYQRGHVWTEEQQIAFVEYGLMGGESSMVITTNCPGWMADFRGPYELMDGLQRTTAVQKFFNHEIKAFGHDVGDFTRAQLSKPSFSWQILNLPNRKEILNFYILMNSGGTVHSPEEIERVKKLLEVNKDV